MNTLQADLLSGTGMFWRVSTVDAEAYYQLRDGGTFEPLTASRSYQWQGAPIELGFIQDSIPGPRTYFGVATPSKSRENESGVIGASSWFEVSPTTKVTVLCDGKSFLVKAQAGIDTKYYFVNGVPTETRYLGGDDVGSRRLESLTGQRREIFEWNGQLDRIAKAARSLGVRLYLDKSAADDFSARTRTFMASGGNYGGTFKDNERLRIWADGTPEQIQRLRIVAGGFNLSRRDLLSPFDVRSLPENLRLEARAVADAERKQNRDVVASLKAIKSLKGGVFGRENRVEATDYASAGKWNLETLTAESYVDAFEAGRFKPVDGGEVNIRDTKLKLGYNLSGGWGGFPQVLEFGIANPAVKTQYGIGFSGFIPWSEGAIITVLSDGKDFLLRKEWIQDVTEEWGPTKTKRKVMYYRLSEQL